MTSAAWLLSRAWRLFAGAVHRRGFTLVELMLVVAIMGVLAAVAMPKFSQMLRKAREGTTKGNLGRIRSALNIYYADNEGWYPSGSWSSNSTVLSSTLLPRYLSHIPKFHPADYHLAATTVFAHQNPFDGCMHDGGGWGYDGMNGAGGWAKDAKWGWVWIFCTHTDSKGTKWTAY